VRALLLAAGLGTRLRPLTETVPKCLVPIHGRPLLGYWLDLLAPAGIEPILINTHYLADAVRQYVASSRWRDRIDLVHEDALLGTAGTALRNRAFFGGEAFLLAHADNLTCFDVAAFVAAHRRRRPGVEITMMTFETDSPRTCGIVEQDQDGVVRAFHEKVADPPGTRANAAVYIVEPSVLDALAGFGRDVIDLSTEVLPGYLGRIQAFHHAGYHRDIGSIEALRRAHAEFEAA
jgi:mannose-1-phosphate guanylyltransferase